MLKVTTFLAGSGVALVGALFMDLGELARSNNLVLSCGDFAGHHFNEEMPQDL
jgi:hypothetical protein